MSDRNKRKRNSGLPGRAPDEAFAHKAQVDRTVAPPRAYVVEPDFRNAGAASARDAAARLAEAVGLAAAIKLNIVGNGIAPVHKIRASTLLGEGKVNELGAIFAADDIELVIVDATLSPVQQRNLERAWNTKVLDRTGLILEIFGERARTSEGRLQVELAHLNYQKSRLVRSWTHLERQRGGVGFLGGPGETQIEADRRQIQERISRLETQLERVRKTRELHRKSRRRVPYPIVALVGYTNAGKSTLFNALTEASVFAEDLLFATLDPTLRKLKLPGGRTAILSDTVGFISDLPTHLIAAFRATLEEVVEADIVLHVRDISHVDSAAQARDVEDVLGQLGVTRETAETNVSRDFIEVWNKIDCLAPEQQASLRNMASRRDDAIAISALTGEGLDALLNMIEAKLSRHHDVFTVHLGHDAGADENWIRQTMDVLSRKTIADGDVEISVRVPVVRQEQFRARFKGRIVQAQQSLEFAED